MRISNLLAVLLSLSLFNMTDAIAGASGHAGHTPGTGSGGGGACTKARLSKFLPGHLATVAPEAEFSFVVTGIQSPDQVDVTVKTIPVEITGEDKDSFYLIKGKLPTELKNVTARINVKVNAKSPRCDAENGWLVKITE
ncbi:hypothetical protein [Methylobacter sp. YRD-M1]|uniref:hypothetical protein n=1 Tax=Methylobacter sp. YRD-M1 TaxID=2911520 RepID=UPI00227C21DB|nr:hypothetical protein [Methylobacter sp. YRD-M1]WAK00974.1 hypothetical protein LZ558_14145 [Methylobacter sp. YRD-M1]